MVPELNPALAFRILVPALQTVRLNPEIAFGRNVGAFLFEALVTAAPSEFTKKSAAVPGITSSERYSLEMVFTGLV